MGLGVGQRLGSWGRRSVNHCPKRWQLRAVPGNQAQSGSVDVNTTSTSLPLRIPTPSLRFNHCYHICVECPEGTDFTYSWSRQVRI